MFKKGDVVRRISAVGKNMEDYGVVFGGYYRVESRSSDGCLTLEGINGLWVDNAFALSTRTSTETALAIQHGGKHYKGMKIQPVEFIHANNIGYMEGNAIKYLCRWQLKNGLEDLEKAKHYIELLIEMEKNKNES